MKKKHLFIVLALVLCFACALAACSADEDPTTYTVALECDCLDGCDVDLGTGAGKNATSITVEEGNTLYITISIKDGWSADDLVVKLNDSVLTVTDFEKDNRYNYDVSAITENSKVTVTGVTVKNFSVKLPTAAETPSGIVSVAIDQYLKKGAENSVAYDGQSIGYGDSVRIKVVTEVSKAMESFNRASNVYLVSKINALETVPVYTNDGVNNYYYVNNIQGDVTTAFRSESDLYNSTTVPDALSPRYVMLTTDCAGVHCAIYPYSVETHAAETSPNADLGAIAYGTDFCFVIADNSSSDYVNFSNVTFTLNGEPLEVSVETDSVNSQKYYRFTATEDGKIGVNGLTVNTGKLPSNSVVYGIDNSGLRASDINFRNKALYTDSRGCMVFYSADEYTVIDGSTDIYPDTAGIINSLSFHVGTDGINYNIEPVLTLTAQTKDNVTYPVIRDDPMDEAYQIIKYRIIKSDETEKWVMIYSVTTPAGTTIHGDTISLNVATSQPLYISLICQTTPRTATLNLKEATYNGEGNVSTTETDLAANRSVAISHDATTKILTIKNETAGYTIKVTNVIKDNDDYKVLHGDYDVTTTKVVSTDTNNSYVIRFRQPNLNPEAYSIALSQDEWGRYIKEGDAYVSHNEASSDEIDFIVSCA